MLFIIGGLPATGKSELAAYLAREARAFYLRIDTIEQAMREGGITIEGPEGYLVAYRVAGDNLRLGQSVVADSVNPLELTRASWREVARQADAPFCEIEVICSDRAEHRRRVESRQSGVPGLRLPTWQQVLDRKYEPWPSARIAVDTAASSPAESKQNLIRALAAAGIEV